MENENKQEVKQEVKPVEVKQEVKKPANFKEYVNSIPNIDFLQLKKSSGSDCDPDDDFSRKVEYPCNKIMLLHPSVYGKFVKPDGSGISQAKAGNFYRIPENQAETLNDSHFLRAYNGNFWGNYQKMNNGEFIPNTSLSGIIFLQRHQKNEHRYTYKDTNTGKDRSKKDCWSNDCKKSAVGSPFFGGQIGECMNCPKKKKEAKADRTGCSYIVDTYILHIGQQLEIFSLKLKGTNLVFMFNDVKKNIDTNKIYEKIIILNTKMYSDAVSQIQYVGMYDTPKAWIPKILSLKDQLRDFNKKVEETEKVKGSEEDVIQEPSFEEPPF